MGIKWTKNIQDYRSERWSLKVVCDEGAEAGGGGREWEY